MVSAKEATATATRSPIIFMSGFRVVMPVPTWLARLNRPSRSFALMARTTSIGILVLNADAGYGVARCNAQDFLRFLRQADGVGILQRRAVDGHGAEALVRAGGHGI